jgi:hypothetical protein
VNADNELVDLGKYAREKVFSVQRVPPDKKPPALWPGGRR